MMARGRYRISERWGSELLLTTKICRIPAHKNSPLFKVLGCPPPTPKKKGGGRLGGQHPCMMTCQRPWAWHDGQ